MVHGGGGEGVEAKAEEEARDDNQDALGTILHKRGNLQHGGGGGEGLRVVDLVRPRWRTWRMVTRWDEGRGVGGVWIGLEMDEKEMRTVDPMMAETEAGGSGGEDDQGGADPPC